MQTMSHCVILSRRKFMNDFTQCWLFLGCPKSKPNWTKTGTAIKIQKNWNCKPQYFHKIAVYGFLQEIQLKNGQDWSTWKKCIISNTLLSLKFLTECLMWLLYLKFLVYLQECAEFDKTWSSRLNFISTETKTTNRTAI